MLVVGDREAAEGRVSVRARTAGDLGASSVDDFISKARDEIARKAS
jgi:threonyl-tRNA synthetase